MRWWLVAFLIYLVFNIGFHLRGIHDVMRGDPVWPRWHRYRRGEIAGWVMAWIIVVVLPMSIWMLMDVLGKRAGVELRMRKGARRV